MNVDRHAKTHKGYQLRETVHKNTQPSSFPKFATFKRGELLVKKIFLGRESLRRGVHIGGGTTFFGTPN